MSESACPYCDSKFETKEELSKHIDRIHHGSGLLRRRYQEILNLLEDFFKIVIDLKRMFKEKVGKINLN